MSSLCSPWWSTVLALPCCRACFCGDRTGDFVCRSLKPRLYRQLGLAYASSQDLSPAARIFLEYAKDFLLDD